TGIPDLSHCIWTHGLATEAGACTCPAGDGDPLSAMLQDGVTVDGTITVHMLDMFDQPIVNYPAEDLWLEGLGMGFCLPPPSADGPTDAQGLTTFTLSPNFRGVQTGPLLVVINGDVMADAGGALFRFASVDLDGSGEVNLSDVILFANRYTPGDYHPSVDFYHDGTLNLSDVVVLAEHMHHRCP
ncbi:hypothetical protein KDK88_04385, partial [bacterium]|nr:hypothetical protein [bacterium]